MKREIFFNKNLEENKKTFKYQNYILFDRKKRAYILKDHSQNNDVKNKTCSSLFLTQNILNKSNFPFINKDNSYSLDLDSKNNNDYFKKLNNKTNTIFSSYNNFKHHRKKINIKLLNEKYSLKSFDIKRINEKELENKSLIENKRNYKLIKKQIIYDNIRKKDFTRIKYIENIKDYLNYKMNLNVKKEKEKVIKENVKEKINLIEDRIINLKNNYDIFSNQFLIKFDKYSKQLFNKIKYEKNFDDKLIECINKISQKIMNLKLKISKINNNYNELNKYIYIFICIQEKKLQLPNYYKIIIENKIKENLDELKNINKNEIQRILNYKKNITDLKPEYLDAYIKRYENEDLDLIKKYNILRDEIIILNEEKELIKHNIFINEKDPSSEIIKAKNNTLLNLKIKYNKLYNYKKTLLPYMNSYADDDEETMNNNKLYYKTNKMINDFNKYIKYEFEEKKYLIRGDKKNALILYNLSKLEILVNTFMSKVAKFKKEFPNKLNFYKMLIDRNKRIRNALEQKNIIELKLKNENKRIYEKNEKLVIIPTHKLNYNNMLAKNLNKKKNKIKNEIKVETVYDFLDE